LEQTINNRISAAWSNWVSWFGLRVLNGFGLIGNYRVEKNISLGSDTRQSVDYYTTGKPCRGIVFFIYGGNWMDGRKQDYRFLAAALCREGFDVVIPDYRLYPKVRFNEIIQDVTRAMAWLLARDNSSKPVFVMGHSAGAQMGALICLNRQLLTELGVNPEMVSGFIGLAGPYDFYPYTEPVHYDLFGPEQDYPKSQPVNYVSNTSVPMLLLHGRDDQRVRRGHSKSLMEKVCAAGGNAERAVYDNMGHVDIIVAFSGLLSQRWPVLEDVCRFTVGIAAQTNSTASDQDGRGLGSAPLEQTYS
jgi:acetyl esterase/lipase